MKLHDNALILSHIVMYQHIALCVYFYQYGGGIVWNTTAGRGESRKNNINTNNMEVR